MLMLAFAIVITIFVLQFLFNEYFVHKGREHAYRLRALVSLPLAVLTCLQGWLGYSAGLVTAANWLWFSSIGWSVIFIISIVILANYARQRRQNSQQ